MNSWATPRWVTGMPGDGRDGDRAGQPRDHGDRHAGLAAGEDLLVAAAEDEVVAALEPHHPLAGERPLDDDPVDLLLLGRAAARQLGDVDQLDVGGQLAEQLARGQPVGDHDVGLHQRLAAGDRDQLGVARAAADQHHARRPVALVPGDDGALAQALQDLVAYGGGALRLALAEHRDGHPGVPADRRGPGGGPGGVVGADAEDPARLGRGARPASLTSRSSVAAMTYQASSRSASSKPRACQVISPAADHALDRRGDLGRDQVHVGADRDQLRHPALGDVPAADDDHAPAGQQQARGVDGEVVHRTIIPAPAPGR